MKRLRSPGEILEELIRLRRDNARLRGWLRKWRRDPTAYPFPLYRDIGVSVCELDAALKGDAPPKRRAR